LQCNKFKKIPIFKDSEIPKNGESTYIASRTVKKLWTPFYAKCQKRKSPSTKRGFPGQ
jgi:hypothetical protein